MRRPLFVATALMWASCWWALLGMMQVSGFALVPRTSQHNQNRGSPSSITAKPASRIAVARPILTSLWNQLSMATAGPETIVPEDSLQPDRNDTATLWSYVSNLQRVRRENSTSNINAAAAAIEKQNLLKPVLSLLHFLRNHKVQIPHQPSVAGESVSEPLSRALVQALRIASPLNDYRLIGQLVDAVQLYCNQQPLTLDPRILGEAVGALTATTAGIGKIKAVWKVIDAAAGCDSMLTRAVGPLEVNAMLTALDSRGKIRAALDLYQHYAASAAAATHSDAAVDAYSLSILVTALTRSIRDQDQPTSSDDTDLNNRWSVLESSGCWQWRETVQILQDVVSSASAKNRDHLESSVLLNNHVLSAVLQLNERAFEVFGRRHHHGAAIAVEFLDWMKANQLEPDLVTCTLLLTSLSTESRIAVNLLRDMQRQHVSASDSSTWSLPRPNAYSYSAAIASCARCRDSDTALELLDELRAQDKVGPNTVVYNAVLQALVQEARDKKKDAKGATDRLWKVLQLLERMQEDCASGLDTAPDTVTYNTVLSALVGIAPGLQNVDDASMVDEHPTLVGYVFSGWSLEERIVYTLLDRMEQESVERDPITYRHAMFSVGSGGLPSVLRLLDRAIKESKNGRDGSIDLFNAGMSVLADAGDVNGAVQLLASVASAGAAPNQDTTVELIRALGRGQKAALIPLLLLAISGKEDAVGRLAEVHAINIDLQGLSPLEATHFSAAMTSCLLAGDFESARGLLVIMQDLGMRPSDSSLQEIARTYATVALQSASSNNAGQVKSRRKRKSPQLSSDASVARARNAYVITTGMNDVPAPLLSIVSKACASAGMFDEAHSLLRQLHRLVLDRLYVDRTPERKRPRERFAPDAAEQLLPGLHRSLMRFSADKGNVTAALWFVEDIQYLSSQLSWNKVEPSGSILREDVIRNDGDVSILQREGSPSRASYGPIGMKVAEWKSLLVAASKSGHWKVCLSTLQFVRPYLEALHPSLAQDEASREQQQRKYEKIAPALTAAIKCLAIRSQYGWCVRSIYDWIDWSGRVPPKEAVLASARILAARGRGQEVNSLLEHCTAPSLSDGAGAYETSLYVGAITTLYNEGLYDNADDAFVAAIVRDFLPLSLEKQAFGAEQRITLDLHGMNVAVAHSAVRIALQEEVLSISWDRRELWDNDMVIVTGRGRNSALRMRPVLRPEVQRMLVEEFYPPLNTASVPGNMGALRVPAEDIEAWLSHQHEQKGVRMLTVAAVLKDLSSGDRLRAALSQRR